ncbi:hypothetical protein D9M70_496850 [compost metagenome]
MICQGVDGVAQGDQGLATVGGCRNRFAKVLCNQIEEALLLAPIQPDDGCKVGQLLWGEVVDLARDFAIGVACIKHQYMLFVLGRLGFIEEPQLARYGTGVKEIRANGDHGVDMASFYQFLPHTGLVAAGAGSLG